MLEANLVFGAFASYDRHRDMRMDIDDMSYEAKGLVYAMNTAEELKFVKDIAASTGIVLDPVYSGKAVYGLLKDMAGNPAKWKGRRATA
ncbi:Bifunctional D-cysteine desulfhydrase/1-aminocyclopropane-1-carboxylate deaminase mitochondrial [Zea mays]|uniref:Bifunctional D-cysteine desulfhydrase/1-aminocyclopropane-1-carboxylate deaminase mitochondrial n=1 Tax=Zea mays TaxID=4577 RepID=A0A1D6PEY8_MAIZE|nr:Bifunctional D-cysteine desulfhydrase/1-aminocyclopropane-1-carboxylate deaminase mitochondrial [Zea mays]